MAMVGLPLGALKAVTKVAFAYFTPWRDKWMLRHWSADRLQLGSSRSSATSSMACMGPVTVRDIHCTQICCAGLSRVSSNFMGARQVEMSVCRWTIEGLFCPLIAPGPGPSVW